MLIAAAGAGLAGSGAGAAAQDIPLTAHLEEVYRVGGLNSPNWAQFNDPWLGGTLPTGFDAAGNLHVLDRGASQVVVIDARGELVRTVGRKGEGPGEFTLPIRLGVWPDGRLVVTDFGRFAYQIFGPDGKLDHFVKMSRGPIGQAMGATKVDPTGLALIVQGVPPAPGTSDTVEALTGTKPEKRVDDRGLERVDLRGDVITFELALQTWRIPREELVQPGTEAVRRVTRFLEPDLLWDVLPDGTIAWSDSSAYVIKVAWAGGPVIDALRRPIAPEAVTESIRFRVIDEKTRDLERLDSAAKASPATVQRFPGMVDHRRRAIQNAEFFEEVPVVRGVRATWDGGLWIQRRGGEPWDDDGPIDIFGADRVYVGTFSAGAPGMPAAFGPDGLVAYWEFDEFDVPTIVVKRLPAGIR